MRIAPFQLERWQSLHEHNVAVNLSDSGAHPLTVAELIGADLGALADLRLGYTQTNGTGPLRTLVADTFPGAGAQNVLITTGGVEANFLALWHLIEPGDEVVLMEPNYGQIRGLAESLGAVVKPWTLRPDWERGRFLCDPEELKSLVSPRTKLVCICNPNNPTGAAFAHTWLDAVGAVCEEVGAWSTLR